MKIEGDICVFGDSIVWGAWDKECAGWVNRLSIYYQNNHPESIVYNLGIPGETSSNLIKRMKKECEARNPSTIILGIGINDALYLIDKKQEQTDITTFEINLNEIIRIAKSYSKNIIFIGLTKVNEKYTNPISWNLNESYFNQMIEKYNEKIKEICLKNKINFIDVYDILELQDLSEDGIHPNSMGHKKLFERINEKLEEI